MNDFIKFLGLISSFGLLVCGVMTVMLVDPLPGILVICVGGGLAFTLDD